MPVPGGAGRTILAARAFVLFNQMFMRMFSQLRLPLHDWAQQNGPARYHSSDLRRSRCQTPEHPRGWFGGTADGAAVIRDLQARAHKTTLAPPCPRQRQDPDSESGMPAEARHAGSQRREPASAPRRRPPANAMKDQPQRTPHPIHRTARPGGSGQAGESIVGRADHGLSPGIPERGPCIAPRGHR